MQKITLLEFINNLDVLDTQKQLKYFNSNESVHKNGIIEW